MTLDQESLETRLRDALRERAESTLFEKEVAGRRAGPLGGHPRRARFAVVAITGVAAAVAALLVMSGTDGDQRLSTVPPAGDSAPSDTPPRVVVGLPGASVARVRERSVFPMALPTFTYMSVYRVPGQAVPVLFVQVVPPPSQSGLASVGTEQRTVNGRPAYLHREGDQIVTLGIPADGGGGLSLMSFGLDGEELVAAAEALAPRSNGASGVDAIAPLPRGLTLTTEGGGPQPGGVFMDVLLVMPDGTKGELRVEPSSPVSFERLVMDRVGGARSVEGVSILDRPGHLVVYNAPGNDSTVMWQPAEGWLAELRAPVDAGGMRAIAAAIRQLDEAAWRAVIPAPVPPETQAEEARRLQADIPLPTNSSWDGLAVGSLDPERYEFNLAVARHALCAWADEYRRAVTEGRSADATRAAGAIASAPGWKSLKEIEAAGGYSERLAKVEQSLAELGPAALTNPELDLRC